jgi:L-threonylcarbamoyladenylate synthase
VGEDLSAADVLRASAVLHRGGIVVVPTDTVYGVAASVERPDAIARIFALKNRDPSKTLQVLIPDRGWLNRYARASEDAATLAQLFWPGPLTLLVPAAPEAPKELAPDGVIGLRVPDHPIVKALLAHAGPLAASSANLAGAETPPDVEGIYRLFGDDVDVYLDGGPLEGTGSTVVDLTGDRWTVVRDGVVSSENIERALRRDVPEGPI